MTLDQWFSTGGEFPTRGEFCIFEGGIFLNVIERFRINGNSLQTIYMKNISKVGFILINLTFMLAIVLSKLFFLLFCIIMVNCCFLIDDSSINFLIIAMVFVLHKTIILKLFSFVNTILIVLVL